MAWWVAGATVGSAVIGGISGSGSASRASDAQVQANRESIAAQQKMFEMQLELLEPYRQAGLPGLEGLLDLSTPEGQAEYLQQYYQSPEFAAQSQAATNTQLAASEATGGLQSTSTQNQLARISPAMGTAALERQLNMYGNLANIGLSGSGSQAGYAGQFGQQQAAALQNIGAAQAGGHLARGQGTGNVFNTLGGLDWGKLGPAIGGLF